MDTNIPGFIYVILKIQYTARIDTNIQSIVYIMLIIHYKNVRHKDIKVFFVYNIEYTL